MCKQKVLLRGVLLIAGLLVWFGSGTLSLSETPVPDPPEFTPRVGEVLEYKMILKSVIFGAVQSVQVLSTGQFDGRPIYNIRSTLNSVGLVKSLSNYSEIEDLKLDAEGLYPRMIRREIHNGGKIQIEEVCFYYEVETGKRRLTLPDGTVQKSSFKLTGSIQDAVSLPFFFRKGLGKSPNKVLFYSNSMITEVNCEITPINKTYHLKSGDFTGYYQFSDPNSNITIMIGSQGERIPFLIRMIAGFGKIESQLVKIR